MGYVGEFCNKCGKARFLHPMLYYYECPVCKYAYYFIPGNIKGIRIIHKSLVKGNR